MRDTVETLYHSGNCVCMADKTDKLDAPLIDEKAIDNALRHIASGKFNPAADIEPHLFEATRNALDIAARKGVGEIAYGHPDHDFYQQLKYNNAVFAAFKTHRQQNELATLLLDQDGTPKSFAQFKKDTQNITGDYNINWLQTEYNTAIIRARNAVQERQFRREKNIYPNLEWLPSMAAVPRESHKIFYNRVWAQDDPFWNSHRPGETWGCKCGLRSTARPVTEGNPTVGDAPKASPGLDNNPATDAKLFADTHPYIALSDRQAKKAVAGFLEEGHIYDPADTEKRIKRNKELSKQLKKDKNYTNVTFDKKTGGLKAEHGGHNFDKVGGAYERHVQEAGFKAGHAVVLENEFSKTIGERFTEGTWDGLPFEVAGRETATVNNILRGLKHCAAKRVTQIAILDFPNGGFNEENLKRAMAKYKGLEKLNDGQYLKFEKVICVQDETIVSVLEL